MSHPERPSPPVRGQRDLFPESAPASEACPADAPAGHGCTCHGRVLDRALLEELTEAGWPRLGTLEAAARVGPLRIAEGRGRHLVLEGPEGHRVFFNRYASDVQVVDPADIVGELQGGETAGGRPSEGGPGPDPSRGIRAAASFLAIHENTVRPTPTTGSGGRHPQSETDQREDSRKESRYQLREVLWEHSKEKRLQMCGRFPAKYEGRDAATPRIRANEDGATYWAGVIRCGSVWSCPVCGPKIRQERAVEVDHAMVSWLGGRALGAPRGGGSVLFLTFTMPHDATDDLAALFDGLGKAWQRVLSGRAWQDDKADFGVAHWFRTSDVTHGQNGWHPHWHAALFSTRRDFTPELVRSLESRLYERWADAIEAAGFRRPTREHGIHLELARTSEQLANYLLKVQGDDGRSVAMELTRTDLKEGRGHQSRTPFQILAEFKATGDADQLELWHEWESASKGRHFSQWSRGAKAALEVPELTDEEIVAQEEEGAHDVFIPTPNQWLAIVATRGAMGRALTVCRREGVAAVTSWARNVEAAWLARRRIRWRGERAA